MVPGAEAQNNRRTPLARIEAGREPDGIIKHRALDGARDDVRNAVRGSRSPSGASSAPHAILKAIVSEKGHLS
jgi:hypothetical protein